MEEIYKPQYFNATDHINLNEYFTKYKSELFKEQTIKGDLKTKLFPLVKSICEFNDDQFEELDKICSVDHLYVEGEIKQVSLEEVKNTKTLAFVHDPGVINDDSRTLHTVREVEKRLEDTDKNRRLLRKLGDRMFHIKVNRKEAEGIPDLQPGEDFIVSVRFFRSFMYNYSHALSLETARFDHEITLLGTNTLADLRDKIKCPTDVTILTEVSEDPKNVVNLESAKEMYPSGFFFIDDVFYNDFRNKDAIDYSEVIRNWAKGKKIADFEVGEMDKVQIKSLKPRFGYPYVYQHQGKCEHIFIFSYGRILNSEDILHSSCYPFYSDIGGAKAVYCFICGQRLPVWLVADCDRMPQNNTLLCNDCFTSYCYKDNEKVGNFKAYPYVHRNALF